MATHSTRRFAFLKWLTSSNNGFLAIPLTLLKVAQAALPLKCSSSNQIQGLLGLRKGMYASEQRVNVYRVNQRSKRGWSLLWMRRNKERNENDSVFQLSVLTSPG